MTLEDALVFIAVGQYLNIKGEYPTQEMVDRLRNELRTVWIPKYQAKHPG